MQFSLWLILECRGACGRWTRAAALMSAALVFASLSVIGCGGPEEGGANVLPSESGAGAGGGSGPAFTMGGEEDGGDPFDPSAGENGSEGGSQGVNPGEGNPPETEGGTVSPGDTPDPVCGHGTIYGLICSKTAQMFVNDAKVWIDTVDCDGSPLVIETMTDGQGFYTLENVPSGLQTIRVHKDEFSYTNNVLVLDGMLTDVTGVGYKECFKVVDQCPTGGVWGYVCHEDGTPFGAGADIAIDGIGCDGEEEHYETATDADGNYFFGNLMEGTWQITVAAAGEWLAYSVVVKSGEVLQLQEELGSELCVHDFECGEGTLTGYACTPDAAGFIGGAQVTVTGTDCEGAGFQASAFTDANGIYLFTGLPSGPASVVVEKEGLTAAYDVIIPAGGTANAADTVSELCFPAPCVPGGVTGFVCAPGKDFFIGGAKVWTDGVDCDGNFVHLETYSDANGVYMLQGVPAGQSIIHVEKGGFTKEYTVTIVGGEVVQAQDLVDDLCFPPGQEECDYGDITGYVCAPNGTLAIGGAHVWTQTFDCKGNPFFIDTFSDELGNFVLKGVPAGQTKVFVEKGSFKTEYVVTVPPGGSVHAPDVVQDACFEQDQVEIAVVTGEWDSIEQILSQLGVTYDLYDGKNNTNEAIQLLTDLPKMSKYDIIFFDCGADHHSILTFNTSLIVQNLGAFVANGGSIYASDWAFVYAEWPWPGAIDFFGGDMNNGAPKVGQKGTVPATVIDGGLAAVLGKTSVAINYNLSAWVVIASAPFSTTVHITGNVPLAGNKSPLMVSHNPGGGKVLYTTFHNESQPTQDMIDVLNHMVFEL